MNHNQMGVFGIVALVLVGWISWTTSAYVADHRRVLAENVTLKTENTTLKTENAALTKEINGLHDQLRLLRPGYRPGVPIGNAPGAVGTTPGTK